MSTRATWPDLSFRVGRWTISVLDPDALWDWCWRARGYDGLWDRWGFGFVLSVERDTDYLLELDRTDRES